MSRGIGVGTKRVAHATVRSSLLAGLLAVTALPALVPVIAPALAGETASASPPVPAGRFSETEMLDAARRAAASGENRPVNIGVPPPDELRVLEARREAELKRLSEKLKRSAEARGP